MFHSSLDRRQFVTHTARAGVTAGAGAFGFLGALPSIGETAGPGLPRVAAVSADLEALVRLIEDTPRPALLERVTERIRTGVPYQDLLSAVFLAGVRGIQPRPVGFKFHAVLVINSAHLATLAAADQDRWLPLLWSIDYFKSSQERNRSEGDWRMAPPDEGSLPPDHQARERFVRAMENWDVAAADQAITTWGRSGTASEVFEAFWLLGARDFRDIGHKAIYVANAWRTLQTIGWRHAEPVLRSLAYALLDHEQGNPAKRDDWRDRPGRDNLVRARKMAAFRHAGKVDAAVSKEVLQGQRTATAEEASRLTAEIIERGIHPGCIWDGLFLTAGELLARQPGIVGLHCLTTVNALHFGYQTTGVATTRAYLLLQAAAFLALFRGAMAERGKMTTVQLDRLEPATSKEISIDRILTDVSRDRGLAASETLAHLQAKPESLPELMRAARRLIFAKGTDSHDYKFSSAVLEDALSLTPALRPYFLAASMYQLRGSKDRDNTLIQRARAALART